MDIVITAIHCEVSDSVKDYAREKVAKLDKFFDKARKTEVNIHAEEGNNSVELVCSANQGHVFIVHVAAEESIRAAIDLAVDKMTRQLRRYKERVRGHKGADKRAKLVRDIKRITERLEAISTTDGEEETFEDVVDDEVR